MKLWILLFQTALGVVTPGFLQGLEINWKSGANPHGRVSAQKSSKTMQHTALTDSRLKILARFGILSPSWPGPCCPWFWNASFRKIFGPDGRYWFSQTYLVLIRGWQWYWWHYYVVDFMMVTDFRCWLPNHYVGDFFSLCWWFSQGIKSVTNISNLSLTHLVSNIRHQHR